MRADLIVIRSVILQNATQLRFVEHDQVIEAFAPNRSDEALDVALVQSCRMQMMRLMRLEFGFGLLIRFIRFATSHSVS